MKTLIIYDSVSGNTEIVARAIGAALPGEFRLVRVGQENAADLAAVDLLVVGSPTHGARPTPAVQSLLERIGPPAREGARLAAFDTRLTWPFLERWGGFAASKIADQLREKGWTLVGAPGGFFVKGIRKAVLKRGETDRAAAWARTLCEEHT